MSDDNDADDQGSSDIDPRITAAIKFMRRVSEVDNVNRENAKLWRKFCYGEQWPVDLMNSRQLEQRPCLTINKVEPFCQQVENQQRQQRPRIKVEPTDGQATVKVAKVIKGLIRHIETNRNGGDLAYDTGFSHAVREGVGYWRVLSDYVRDDAFEQELYLSAIEDPLTVYYDDNSVLPDGSDAEEVLIVADMGKATFKSTYPDADAGDGFRADDSNADWITKETVRVAEYFYMKREKAILCKLTTGEVGWKDQIKPGMESMVVKGSESPRQRKTIKWCKLTASEILEERDLPGRWIPVFPCYGTITVIDGKRRKAGLVKNAMDPQRMSNFWKTAMTESVALAPKAKYLLAEGQDEGFENEWAQANNSAKPILHFKQTDTAGQPAPPPQRVQPEPPPSGMMVMAQAIDQDLTSVLGIVDPAMRIGGNVSGKALNAERMQSDNSTFHFYDNMTRSIAFTGRYLLDVLPYYYNEPGRVVRIVGDDGTSMTDNINAPHPEDPQKIINDISVGQYDIVMDTGPGFNTKRQEAVENMMPLFEKDPELMKMAGDIMFRNMDFPGADVIADRLAAGNPLSQIDEKSEIPPAVQMKLKQGEMQIKQMGEHIQQLEGLLKSRADVEAMRQAAESHRTDIKEAAQTQRNREDNQQWSTDIHTKSLTALSVAEINQAGKIITQDKQHKHDMTTLDKVAEREDAEVNKEANTPG